MHLDQYSKADYTVGAGLLRRILWFFVGSFLVESRVVPFSALKVRLLRAFGARIGTGVRIKPGVRVKFPWRLTIGDHSWIGEQVWIDNLATVSIGNHVCVSQGAYLCTGSHNWARTNFELQTVPITLSDHSWVAAKTLIAPGVTVEEFAVLTLGSVALKSLEARGIYSGNPATKVGERKINDRG
jgi:putative colanic acid biosynthesis acetyltransferase WcaF